MYIDGPSGPGANRSTNNSNTPEREKWNARCLATLGKSYYYRICQINHSTTKDTKVII
jgi:hypothetical protein